MGKLIRQMLWLVVEGIGIVMYCPQIGLEILGDKLENDDFNLALTSIYIKLLENVKKAVEDRWAC